MIKSVVRNITPELAKEFLLKNTKNYRSYRPYIAQKYADDMAHGLWKMNGEPICFNTSGQLINGQHRLNAIIISGVTVPMLVVYDVEDDINTYDIGLKRSSVDIATAIDPGRKYNSNLLSVASMFVTDFCRVKISSEYISEYAVKHYESLYMVQKIIRAGGANGNGIARNSGCGMAVYISMRNGISEDSLQTFFEIVNSGYAKDGVESTPAITVRNYLLNTGRRTANMSRELYCFTCQGINDFIIGKKRKIAYHIVDYPYNELKKYRVIDGLKK